MQRRKFIIISFIQSLLFYLILMTNTLWAQEEPGKHVVSELDNYYSLSLKYNVSVSDLKNANPDISTPRPGDVLIIPAHDPLKEEPASIECIRLKKSRNEIYRVALMIPLSLEQVADTAWAES